MYIRFFGKDGNPTTDTYMIPKIHDTAWVNLQSMDMDSTGNTVLVWIEGKTRSSTTLSKIRFMSFSPDGTPLSPVKTLYSDVDMGYSVSVSISNKGQFALCFQTRLRDSSGVWVQRFDLSGNPLDSAFLAYDTLPDTFEGDYQVAKASLNEEGDIVVTWWHNIETAQNYPFYQVFDAEDKPINWNPFGHRIDGGSSRTGCRSPHPYWIDNDRFVVFWSDYCYPINPNGALPILGRVFSDHGQTPHEICVVSWGDRLHVAPFVYDSFMTDLSPSGKFAYTHERMYTFLDSSSTPWEARAWTQDAGILGEIIDDKPQRKTSLFEYTPAWDADTIWCADHFGDWPLLQRPAVACNDDRIVWAYCRLNTDTIFEAYALVTDWDMGVGVTHPPVTHPPSSDLKVVSSIGPTVTLRYSNCPQGFRASVYDAGGRKVDQIQSTATSGTIRWGGGHGCYGAGVYFIVADKGSRQVSKVVLVK